MLKMTFIKFCATFSNIKYLGCDVDYRYYFQVDDPRNNCRKLVYTFKYITSQYNPLYDDYEPYDGDEGEVERVRIAPDKEINFNSFKYRSKECYVVVCDDKGNKLQVEDFRNGDTVYINGDPFVYNNNELKHKIVGLYDDYFKPRTISDDILNDLK